MTFTPEQNSAICPTCGHLMITLHASHLHCENCGGQITEEDL
jgi:predicted RNA-binding Zn-ribbon protein involved in translation (DUF1610 family)